MQSSLRQFFVDRSWPGDRASLDTVLNWLSTQRIELVVDLAELGPVTSLPAAHQQDPGTLAFLQSRVEVCFLFSHPPGHVTCVSIHCAGSDQTRCSARHGRRCCSASGKKVSCQQVSFPCRFLSSNSLPAVLRQCLRRQSAGTRQGGRPGP